MNKMCLKIKAQIEFIKELMLVVLSVLLIMVFIVSHNKIPTESMVSTINVNDHVLVTMLPFYYRNPQRGEIVVFKHDDEKWVKRVIGLPGETIDIREGKVYVNDEALDEAAYLAEGMDSTPDYGAIEEPVEFPYTVPQDSYFLMGDNRGNSCDSRYIGAINRELIYGKAFFKIYPINAIGQLK